MEANMCLKDVLSLLHSDGFELTPGQIRWAITSGRISRPRLDGSLRFDFDSANVEELKNSLASKRRDVAAQQFHPVINP
jgi:hypothetical protein